MSEEIYGNAIDSLIQDNRLCMLKAALPYLELRGQRPLSIYVKILELKNTFSLFQQDEETLSACALQKKTATYLICFRTSGAFVRLTDKSRSTRS